MPNYNYRCPECGKEFEATLSISDRDQAECVNCGNKTDNIRIVGTTNFILNGPGFHQNDYTRRGR